MENNDIKTDLLRILEKYRDGTATEKEKSFVETYYNFFDKESAESLPEEEITTFKEHVHAKLLDHIQISGDNSKTVKPLWLRIAVAASVLIACATGAFYYLNHPIKSDQLAITTSNRIVPGGNKAILTLGNGNTIVLTDQKSGLIAQQGAVRIDKTGAGRVAYQNSNNADQTAVTYNTITTPRGGKYEVNLPDGTMVWLDAASSIHFPTAFTGPKRIVSISGQAYFEVAHNRDKPFIVNEGKQSIEVLGTHFNVLGYDDEPQIKTSLLEGSIKIVESELSNLNSAYIRILKPGQQATIDRNKTGINVRYADMDDAIAWKNNLFQFDNDNVKDILVQASRWYDFTIKYQGEIPNKKLKGNISRNVPIEKFLQILSMTGIHFKIDGKTLIVTP